MKIQLFAVYDSASKVFAQPNFIVNKATALRSWTEACNDSTTAFFKHSNDYTMFHLGDYDDETGKFTNLTAPQPLGLAAEFKNAQQQRDI